MNDSGHAGLPELLLVHETESACRERLLKDGFTAQAIVEISSYLAQSTDLAHEFDAIGHACRERGIGFRAIDLDDAASAFAGCDKAGTLVWTLTDGVEFFRGGASPALARLNGLKTIGADDSVFALCQDKFRSGAVLAALGLPVPPAGLARDGRWIVEPPRSEAGWFVKPNRLGAKIGIWADSHCHSADAALALSKRIFAAYRDDCIVQSYVPGKNIRASFLAVDPSAGMDALGVFHVESGGDFQTMQDSLALYGETSDAAKSAGDYREPALVSLASLHPEADASIRALATRLMTGIGLRDVFSMDFRVEANEKVHLIEFEICPGLPCFDFRTYCAARWNLPLADAMAETARRRLCR